LSNISIRTLADILIELGYSNCPEIPTKLILEAAGSATVKSSTDTGTGCIEALLDRRELILIKLGKYNSNKFVIVSTISSFALTFQVPGIPASSLVLFLVWILFNRQLSRFLAIFYFSRLYIWYI
jgi:hypothetical protein